MGDVRRNGKETWGVFTFGCIAMRLEVTVVERSDTTANAGGSGASLRWAPATPIRETLHTRTKNTVWGEAGQIGSESSQGENQ
jgi:hypothetical protein